MRPFSSRLAYALVLLALSCLVVPLCPARAQILVANTANRDFALPHSTTNWFGTQFTVGEKPISVTSATVQIGNLPASADSLALPSARIYSNSGSDTPATLLQTLIYAGGGGFGSDNFSTANFTYAGAPVTLDANTNYYFVLANVGSDQFDAGFSSKPTSTGSAGTVNNQAAQTTDSGGSWTPFTGSQHLFTLSGSVVPEPGTLALLSTGLLPLGPLVLRKRRRSKG